VILIFWPQSVTYWIEHTKTVNPNTIKIEIPGLDLPLPPLDFGEPPARK
jgi:hypothetical protein